MLPAVDPVIIFQCVAFTLCTVAVGRWMERLIVPACDSMGIRSLRLKRALACNEGPYVRPTQRQHRLQDMNYIIIHATPLTWQQLDGVDSSELK